MTSHQDRNALANFKRCAAEAPNGAYTECKALESLLGETCDRLIRELRELGLKADNCDLIYAVETTLYAYAKASNPDATVFPVSEGFGEAMDGPARERVIAQAEQSAQFFRQRAI